ncbi:hypothetical protein AVEN_215516-1 [Araneus ventricosus]|uniref:Uncharacterized protein n=1 Tax=Araneus ventricosus TaxID=182803 RepID=A0A4Y2BH98_ARAVE|nr:hypothetical protein AVEN_215516-1 [Araneus ventricosus]
MHRFVLGETTCHHLSKSPMQRLIQRDAAVAPARATFSDKCCPPLKDRWTATITFTRVEARINSRLSGFGENLGNSLSPAANSGPRTTHPCNFLRELICFS